MNTANNSCGAPESVSTKSNIAADAVNNSEKINPENNQKTQWLCLASSVPGAGHIRRDIPCQDASAAFSAPRPAAIVCDGRGSAAYSHFGAVAAVQAFKSQISVFEPMLKTILDVEDMVPEKWQMFSRIMYRTLMQVKLDLAEQKKESEKEFDFTVNFAIAGKFHLGFFQVGDGSIVVRRNGLCQMIFKQDKGEFANQTSFLRLNGEAAGKFQAVTVPASGCSGIAITSDGPEYLMFKLPQMIPGKIFDALFDAPFNRNDYILQNQQDLRDYLTRKAWNNDSRGDDDRSLALLIPSVSCSDTDKQSDFERTDTAVPENEPVPEETVSEKQQSLPPTPPEKETKGEVCSEFKSARKNNLVLLCAGVAICGVVFFCGVKTGKYYADQKIKQFESTISRLEKENKQLELTISQLKNENNDLKQKQRFSNPGKKNNRNADQAEKNVHETAAHAKSSATSGANSADK